MRTRTGLLTEPLDERAEAERLNNAPGMQVRHLQEVQLRADPDSEGTFDGYACVWDVTDSYGTSFRPGCFSRGGLDDLLYGFLWMHDPWKPVGVFTATEDDHGLRIAGRWDATADGADCRTRAHSGSARGLSVGFVALGTDPDDSSAFTVCRLIETSQITARMAAVPGAELVGVRQAGPEQDEQLALARLVEARLRLLAVHSGAGHTPR